MKHLVLLFIVLGFVTEVVHAQRVDSLMIETFPPRFEAVSVPNPQGFDSLTIVIPERLRLPNGFIDNPGVRYTIQNLKKEDFKDAEINKAVNTILRYTENARVKWMIEYLRNYSKGMAQREKALNTLQEKITADSIDFMNGEYLPKYNVYDLDDEFVNTDLQVLLSYIRRDSNYSWLKKASQDSVLLEISSMREGKKRFWINNGRMNYHRFWAANKGGDTIGTWIQVFPGGNRMRIFVDEDVYKATYVEPKGVDQGLLLSKPFTLDLEEMNIGKLRRRYWTYYSEVEFNMSQGALVNWARGGENSLSLLSNIRYYWNYNRNKTSWENWMHYRFGFMKNGDEDIRKNEDRFEMNSKLGQKAFLHWYYTAQFNMLTQLFNSYDYPKDKERNLVANFMSPGYFTLSLGLDYKPKDNFSLFISPISGKWNFVRDSAKISVTRYGVEKGKRSSRSAGAKVDVKSKFTNVLKIMDIDNQMNLFYSYDEKDRKKGDEKILPLTVNWKMTLSFKINYFLRASIYTELYYDQNSSDKVQFKENLNLGVNFRF